MFQANMARDVEAELLRLLEVKSNHRLLTDSSDIPFSRNTVA